MKNTLVLLALLSVPTFKVCSQRYHADSDGKCRDPKTEYRLEDSNRCCKKCPPGQRLIRECTETTDSVCKQCEPGLYMESWNYAQNCFACNQCRLKKGLQYAQNCSSTTRTNCICQAGMFCILNFDDPYCTACRKYNLCRAGYGVSVQGKANSDVKCQRCPDGMFSDTPSYTEPCWPHTNCNGKVTRKGNATSDTVCENQQDASHLSIGSVFTTPRAIRNTVLLMSDFTLSARPSVSMEVFNHSIKPQPATEVPGMNLAAVIAGVFGVILLSIIVIVVFMFKIVWKKDAGFHPRVDANGNCKSDVENICQEYLGETRMTSFTVNSLEQQCLLEKGGSCSDNNQYSNNAEPLTMTDGSISHESSSPLQSTVAFDNSYSALPEPMTLISNTESVPPQPSVHSRPTSPQIISPMTTSPHVNVNITFHIGNGTPGTPSVIPACLTETDYNLPFGEEEESFSIPQQEDGKQSLRPVQDSAVFEESPA